MSRSFSAIFRISISIFLRCFFVDGGAGLVDVAIAVERVRIAKLMLCDPDAEFGAILGTRAFEACFEFVYGFVLRGAVGGGERQEENVKGKSAHGSQRFFGSMAIRRWVACHS
jgi:hypothetical protein